MGRARKLCRASVAVLLVVVVAQLAAIAAPGWLVIVEGNRETHVGVFYKVICETLPEHSCETLSFRDKHADDRERSVRAGRGGAAIAAIDYDYSDTVLTQVLVMVGVVCSLAALLMQLGRSVVDKRHVRIVILSIALLAISAGLMISVTCDYIVECAYSMDLLSFDGPRAHTYVAFPYSIALTVGSIILQLIAIVTLGAHIYEPKVTMVRKPRKMSVSSVESSYAETKPQSPPPKIKVDSPPSEKKIPPVATTIVPSIPNAQEGGPTLVMKTTVNVTSSRINTPQSNGDTTNTLSEKL